MQQDSLSLQKNATNLFSNLNPQQVEAVKEIDRPLLLIAGAGSGKTLTVASKIVYLIEQGVAPDGILALTFNQKATEELKARVNVMLNSSEELDVRRYSVGDF